MTSVVELGYRAAWRAVQWLPHRAALALFHAGADRAARNPGKGTLRLRANLRRVAPELSEAELDDLVRRGLRSYARYWLETFTFHTYPRAEHLRRFRFDHEAELARLVADGRGAVLALPHSGNWEAAGAWVTAHGWPQNTVAERLPHEGVYQRFLAFRRALGMEIIPTSGGDRAPLDLLAEKLGQGYMVPLLADRDLSRRGVDVTFFGGRARMPGGPALLALRTGAPLYAVHMWYDPDGTPHGALDGPIALPSPDAPLDVRIKALTQEIADRLAVGIARHPEDWHMLQRVWLDEPATTPSGKA